MENVQTLSNVIRQRLFGAQGFNWQDPAMLMYYENI